MSMTWKATRPGNWLFHCHDTAHILQALPIDGSPAPVNHHVTNHALEMMSGPVVGITVHDGFALEDGKTTPPAGPPYLPGPTIVRFRVHP